MKENIRIIINNNKIQIINFILGGSSSFNNLEISQDEIINSLDLLNYFDSNLNSYTATSNLTDLVNVSINNTNLDVTLAKNAYSFPANSLNQGEVLSFIIPDNYSSDLKYFCYSHSSMIGNFTIEDAPVDTSSINTKFYVRLNSNPFNSPYYIFSLTSDGTSLNESSDLVLYRGISYEFEKTDSGHPFNIGSSHNENATGIVVTSNGTGGTVYSEALITVSATDGSTTSSQSFKIKVNQDSEATGTITFTDNVIINQTITATVNLTDNDGSITLSYQWQVSDDNVTFTNTDTNDTTLTFIIPSDYVGKYIRLQVSSVDSEGGVTVVNSYSREVKDVFGDIQVNTSSDNTVIKLENMNSLDTNNTFDGETSLYYSNFTSTDTNIVPTLSSTWDQIGSSIYGEGYADKSGSAVSLSNDGTIIAIGEYNEYADANSDNFGSVRVFELINNVWTQKGSKLFGEKEMDWFGSYIIKLSGDGTKLFVHADRYNIDTNDDTSTNEGKLYIYTFSNNDWINVNSIEGTSNNHYMIFDASDDGTVFTIANQNENKVIVYNYDYSTDVYSVKGSEITGDFNFGQNVSLSGDGNNISIANNIANYYIYTYDTDNNNWVQKGSIVSSDQGKGNSSLKLNYDGSVFIYGGHYYSSYFVKSITENGDVTSVLTNFQNDGYQLKTAYYGTNDGTNLSDGSIYENLNSNKLLNIYDYNKVRYDVHTFSGDYDNPDGGYQTTSYSNDIFKFDFNSNETNHELNDITGNSYNTIDYIKISGFFTPQTTGNYRLISNPTDDGIRIRMREFTTSTDIENDSSSEITLMRHNNLSSDYYNFKYSVYNFTNDYNTPFNSSNYINNRTFSTMIGWNSDADVSTDMNTFSITGSGSEDTYTSNYNTLTGTDTSLIFIKMEVVFSTSTDDEYYFEFFTDDGIRIKIVEFNDAAPNSNTASDWDSLTNIDTSGDYDYETNWEGHPPCVFQYTISLQKYKIYKAYIEYTQGTGGYTFAERIHRSGDSTYRKFEDTFQIYDTDALWDATNYVWNDRDSFTGGGGRSDIGNIYLDNTKNYEFLIEFAQGGGGGEFNFYAENTDENFTSLPTDISTEFVSLVNLKSRLEILKEDSNNEITSTSPDFNVYDPNSGVDKFTYLVFYKDGYVGKSKVYEYKTDVEATTDWYQVGNDILGLETNGWGGRRSTLDKSGKQIATTDIRSGNGTVRLLKHDPIGTSILNFYGSGIDSTCTILANNEKLYQDSRLFSPNENYQLSFQANSGNLVLYGNTDSNWEGLYYFNITDTISEGNPNTYIVMEDGNLNIYDNGQHKLSYTSDSTSGVLALDNNGNFSIVESWIEWQRFSGGGEQGSSIDFTPDGTKIAIGTKNYQDNIYDQGRTEIFQLNNQLTLASVNSLTTGSSTDISFNVTDGTHTDNKTFTISNIEDSTIGELRIISNTFNLFEGSTLTADISSLYDPDGTISITSYEWEISNSSDFNNYSTITSATNSSFTIPKDTESSFSYVGQYIRLKVVANNTDLFSEPRLVLNIEDEVSGTVSFTSNMSLILEDSILTAVTSISDVDNNKLVVDTNDVGSLNLNYQWQISSDDVTFTNIDTNATSSTYQIPVGTYNGQYIRLLVTSTDRRGGTSNILSTSHLIEELNLVTQTNISDSNYLEGNNYIFDLSSIIYNNFDVSFEVKTDDSNGSTTIDTNKLLTFTPNNDYYGVSTIVVTASTDSSITSITQDITFNIDIQPVDDKPSGTIIYTDNVIINQTITATVNLSDNDGPLTLGYQWQVSDDNSTFTNTDTNDNTLTFVIPSDYVGKYIRLQVSSVDSEGGVTVVNSYSREVKDVFGDIQVNTSSSNTIIKLENTYVSLYNSYYARHHRSDGYENLIFRLDDHDGETFFNDIKYLKNHYITIPDFSGDTFYTFDASDYGSGISYKQLKLRDKYGNRPEPAQNTYYTFNVYSIFDNSSLLYSNVTSTSLYNSYYAMHHRSESSDHETLMSYSGEGQDLYNYTNDLSNHYITIPDFSGDTVYTFNVFIYGDGTYYGLTLRDPDGNRPSLTTNTYYTFNVYSNVSDSNIVPTITSTWEQIGDAFYGTDSNDNLGSMISLSSDGLVVAFKKGSTVEVYEKINENWTQKGSTIDLVNSISYIQISVDGTKLFARIYDYDTNYNNKAVLYKYNNASWEKLVAEYEWSSTYLLSCTVSKDCKLFAIGFRLEKYVEVWKLDDDENGFTQYGNTITEDIYRFGAAVRLSEDGEMICIQNPYGQFVTEVDTNLIGAGFIDVYYYDNGTWTKKGSRIYQEKSMNTVHGFNFDFNTTGNTFSFGNWNSDNYILKMSEESTDASTIISEYENAGYSLHTAYYGNSLDSDNLLNGTIYDSLNDGKLLNINDHNKVRYNIYTLSRDSDNNWDYYNGVYQKTEYRNELLSWSGTIGDSETSNLEVLTGTLGDEGIEIEIRFFISPVTSDDYKFKFLNNDDTSRLYIVEFGNDIDSGLQTLSSHTTVNAISLDSSKNYEFKIIWGHGHGAFVFQSQVDIGNDGTFVDFYNTNNFTFKSRFEVLKEENISFITSHDNYNLNDPNLGIVKYTYYVFKSDAAGSSYIWQYNDRLNEWYQLGNTIYNSPSSLEPENDQSGTKTKLNETGKVIAISERYYENGNVKVMQYNPYGTSIANLYGSGINAPNTILSNNEKLYQGSYITSPNQNYILMFQESNGNLVLRYNSDPENTSIETDYDNFDVLYHFSIQNLIGDNITSAYVVMEYGNLNVYNLSGEHRYSYTTNAKSGVLSLDNNGNLSIVENWIQNGNNITGFRENDENGNDLSISNDGLTLAVGTPYYDGTNNDDVDSGLLRIYNINNVLTLSDVNSLDVGQTIDISIDITDGYGNETKTFTISNIDDTTIGEIRVLSNTIIIYEGTTLTADTTSLTDPDSNINITYQWEISSDSNTYTSITEATNSTFTIPKDTESTESYVGLYIRLKVVANDTEFYSDPKLVINLEDEATGTLSFVSNITSIQEGAILTAVTNISDVDNKKLITDTNDDQPLNLSYQWQISSDNTTFTNIDNATINEYQIPISTYTEQYIRLFITTTDTRGGTTDFVTTSSLIEVNNSPFFNTSPGLVAYEGQEYEYTFTFSDADSNQTISITNITYPSWISFDSSSNKLSGTPTSNDSNDTNNNNDVSITISDGTNETIQNFTIYVNRAPILENDLNLTFDEDEIINPVDLDLYFSDYDTNDTINYTINSYDTNFLTASIDSDRKLNLVLVNNKFGTSNITITATDGYNSITRTGTITINSVNDDPTGTISIIGTALPNQTLTVDLTQIVDVDDSSFIYTYIWQMSSDSNIWDTSSDVSTSSTYTIPDTNDNENKYIRVKVTVEDGDTNNTEFISNEVQIQKLDLVTSFSINGSTDEDINYTFDLSSIIDTNYDVSFEVKTDDSNGLSIIDTNKLLTFTPDNNYNGSSIIIVAASTDSSITSITQDITFNLTINPINDQPTGTVSIIGTLLPNNQLSVDLTQITDIDDSSFLYTYIWQMSSDSNTWDSSTDVATSSTYLIPDTNDNENYYIRVKVTVEDSDTNNTEFISNEVQIQKLDLVTTFNESDTIDEDNSYTFDLSSIIDSNYDVSFEIKTDDSNGTSIIDTNKLLTFTPENNYYGSSSIIITASTDSSVTSITQDITFDITISSINDEPTGTVLIVGNALLNDTLSANLDISDIENDVLQYSYSWEISSEIDNWETSVVVGTESAYTIVEDTNYIGQYIRLVVSIQDSDSNDNKITSSNILEISNVRLLSTNEISETIQEDNNFIYDLNNVKDTNQNVFFSINSVSNGQASIDENDILTFTPDLNYFGNTTILLDVTTDSSITTIFNSFLFNLTVIPVNDEPTGTISIIGTNLPNKELSVDLTQITDIENDSLTYTYLWQMSSDSNTWDTNISTSSTYTIPDTNDNENKYIRVKVNIQDSDTNNTEFISNTIQIEKINLITSFSQTSTIDEDNNYIFNLLSIINTNYDVSFEIKTDDINGTSVIDTNKLLTFTPNDNYNGSSTIIVTASTDISITTITQDITFNITINPINDRPTGTINILGTTLPNKQLSVDLSNITDVDDSSFLYTYIWQMSSDTNTWDSSTNVATSSTYLIPDTNDNENKYIRVKVTVEDNDTNNTEFISNEVQIQKLDLVTLFSQSDTIDEDNNYTFDLSSIIDTNYDVSFNVKTDDSNGTSVIDTNKLITFTPNDHYYGSSSIIVTASTETSITSINQDITFNITINSINDAPTFNDGSFSTDEDVTTTFDLSTLTSDVENDSLTYTIVTPPSKGSASIDGSTLTFVPTLNLNGSDSIEVSVSDGNLSSTSIISVTINPINDAPTINNGSFSANEAEAKQFDLLTLNAIDVDSNSLTYTLKTQPSKGIVLINDTTLTYTSFENEYGSDSFVITVSDGELSADSTIDVLINAVPKILNNFDDLRIEENSDDYIIDLSDKFNDADNSELSYTSISNDTNLINTSILATDNTQLGDDIVGYNSALNLDGTKLIYNDTNDRVTKILKYENENWIQMGSNIEFYTNKFSISHIGNRVAIGMNNLDIIKIYDYTNDWNEILQIDNVELNGEMSFSPDDNWILVGNTNYNNYTGELIIYRCDLNFTLSDNDMRGDNIYDFWGAVSDISNSNIGRYTIAGGATGETGSVKIFYYDHSEELYYQMGSTLNNENTFDGFGFSVSLSNDGSIIAVGAPGHEDISLNDPLSKGYVKIYEYINNEWSLKGQKLEGENLGDFFGQIVKLSSDGLKLAVTLNNQVNIYEYVNDTWIKINYIDYENIVSISLSENADILSISTNSEIKTFSLNESGSPRLKLSLLPNSKGETTINITATDGDALVTNSFNVVVFRENEVPVFDSTPVSVAYEDSLYEYNIQVSDVDIEDSNLTIEVVEKPDWLTFVDNQDKTALLSGTPLVSHIGTHNVVLKVTDTVLESTTQSFTITVIEVNDNPIFESLPITEVDEKSEYLYNIVVSDEENDNVTITTDSALLPSWLTFTQIDKDNAILQGIPSKFDSGEYNIIITATDEHGKSNSQVFTITVNNVNFPPEITSTPILNVLRNNLYDYMITIDHDKPVNISAKNIPYWITLVDNENYTARLFGTPDKNESFNVEIIITEIGGLGKVTNHNFSIKVDSEPYVKNRISDISILTFDDFIYQLPEFININSIENRVSYKKSNLVSYDDWIFFDDNFHTRLGETLSYELFINDNLVDIYDWISFTNGIISINAKYHNIGTHVFKIKVTDVMGNSVETEFNVNVSTSLIRFEKQFYNNNKDALVELDSVSSTEGINLAHNYLKTHNFNHEKYNVIIFNSEENKVKIFEGDNNNHTISDHNFTDTFIISKYLDNIRRTKQSIMIKPNKNLNIEIT